MLPIWTKMQLYAFFYVRNYNNFYFIFYSSKRLLTYSYLLNDLASNIELESLQKSNKDEEISSIIDYVIHKRKITL